MTRHVLVTGVSGSGKSAVAEKLSERGYAAYDIEGIEGLFEMVDGETGEVIENPNPQDVEQMKRSEWVCERKALRQLMQEAEGRVAFYCGTASNLGEILPLFDEVLLLRASKGVLRERLQRRKTNPFGKDVEVREWVLGYKDWWENQVVEAGAEVVDADQDLEGVIADILEKAG